jgi:hypothetical protein
MHGWTDGAGEDEHSKGVCRDFVDIGRSRKEAVPSHNVQYGGKLDDIYGTFQIENGSPKPVKGPLFRSMEKGLVFIADEFNLAENFTIQGLAASLKPFSGASVLIPGLGLAAKMRQSSCLLRA